MIALTLTAPLIGFGLMLFMQWLEDHTMTIRSALLNGEAA